MKALWGRRNTRRRWARCFTVIWSSTSLMVTSLMALLPGALSLIIYSGFVAVLNPFVVILLVGLSVANYFTLRHAQQFDQRNKDAAAEMEKKLQYIDTAASDVKNGKDIRIYDMAGWFERLQDKVLDRYVSLRRKIQSRYFAAGSVNALTLLLRDGAAYVYLIWVASAGRITLGEFVFFFGAITGFSIYVSQIAENLNTIYGASLQMNDMRAFLESTDPPEPENPAQRSGLPGKIGIEFDHVSFSYPGTNVPVLNDLCLTISPGEKVALVGVNGAGKTTLVKLLCGFYRPDSGQILMGGINIDRFLRKDLFRIFSVIFQDITILPFTIAENVSMQLACETEKDRVLACLKMAGLDSDIAKYEKGIDSRMLRIVVDDGVVLSGGQQQKLLMARALYKNAPVFVFDEPTAALDPIAESEVYANFHSIAKDKTAIYISHRLASTRFCDRIAFLKDGRLTECGAHAELMQRGGVYADMFNIQSHYYNHNVEGAVR